MKKQKLTRLLLPLLLTLALLLTSCASLQIPSGGSNSGEGGGSSSTEQGTTGNQGNEQGTTGNQGNEQGGQNNNQSGTQGGTTDEEYHPPVIINPPAPDFEEEDDESFGEYTVYYLFDTDGTAFTLRQLQSNEKGEIRTATLKGTATEAGGGYTLRYDGGEVGYGKYINGVFHLTDESFSCPEDRDERGGSGITEIEITPSEGGTDYGYRDLANLKNGKAMQSFYRELLEECKSFANSKQDLQKNADYYKICELDFAKHGINAEEAQSVWALLRMENPIFYWMSTVCYYTPTKFHLVADEAYATYQSRAAYDADIQVMITEAKALLTPTMNDVERALMLHDYLLSIMDYAYIPGTDTPETAVWAHNIIGAASMGKGVCETYAKTYQLLMQEVGIPTLYVTGYAGEPHAWNLVYLSGEWVGVDLTWDDMKSGAYLTSYFGLSASALAKDHTQDSLGGTGAAYHYKTPTISPLGLSLVGLSENGESARVYANLDDAFCAMTDKNASYSLSFYNYTEHGAYKVAAPDIYYYTTRTALPEAKEISIDGTFYSSSTPFAARLHLLGPSFHVSTPLTLSAIHLAEGHGTHRGVTLAEQLAFRGEKCELTLSYLGRQDAESSATVKANPSLTTNADLNLSELILEGSSPELSLLNGEGHIELLTLKDAQVLTLTLDPAQASLSLYRASTSHINFLLEGEADAHLKADEFLTLAPESLGLSFTVYTAHGSRWRERTDYFTLTEQGAVVLRALTHLPDMTVADGILLSYFGTSPELTLPEGIHSIGACAFADYRGTEIHIPEGILHLRRGAFEHSTLEYITLPASLCTFDTSLSEYTTLAPVKQYTFSGTYADWARIVALSDFVLYYYTTPAAIVCTDGKALTSNPIEKLGENLPLRAVSNTLCDITSMNGVQGKRMHLIDYNEDGDAVLITFDIYSSGAYGAPTQIATLTMTDLGGGRYTFTHKGTVYYITVTNGAFVYTNQGGEPDSGYPT